LTDGAVDVPEQHSPSETDDENEESDVGPKATTKDKTAAAVIDSSSDDEAVIKPVAKKKKGMFSNMNHNDDC
jgi:hypothetical protein